MTDKLTTIIDFLNKVTGIEGRGKKITIEDYTNHLDIDVIFHLHYGDILVAPFTQSTLKYIVESIIDEGDSAIIIHDSSGHANGKLYVYTYSKILPEYEYTTNLLTKIISGLKSEDNMTVRESTIRKANIIDVYNRVLEFNGYTSEELKLYLKLL